MGAVRVAEPTTVEPGVARAASARMVNRSVRGGPGTAASGGSLRAVVAAALLLVPLAAYGGLRALRGRHAAAQAVQTAPPKPAEIHPAPPAPASPATQGATDWLPVPVSTPVTATETLAATAGSGAIVGLKKAAAPVPQSVRPPPAHGPAAQQAASVTEVPAATPSVATPRPPGPNGASCDPPFYIDADGTKRYKRYCADL